jgi:hypothetical protein
MRKDEDNVEETLQSKDRRGPLRSHACGRKVKATIIGAAKSPARSNPELPILSILARSPQTGVKVGDVLKEIRSARWYPELTENDLTARYKGSKKNVVNTVLKYGRKHLVERRELLPPGVENPAGTWKITEKGLERLQREGGGWKPKYAVYLDRIIETW